MTFKYLTSIGKKTLLLDMEISTLRSTFLSVGNKPSVSRNSDGKLDVSMKETVFRPCVFVSLVHCSSGKNNFFHHGFFERCRT